MRDSAASQPVSLIQLGIAIGIALPLTFALSARTASTPILDLGPITRDLHGEGSEDELGRHTGKGASLK
jgi:hypothetical protein